SMEQLPSSISQIKERPAIVVLQVAVILGDFQPVAGSKLTCARRRPNSERERDVAGQLFVGCRHRIVSPFEKGLAFLRPGHFCYFAGLRSPCTASQSRKRSVHMSAGRPLLRIPNPWPPL